MIISKAGMPLKMPDNHTSRVQGNDPRRFVTPAQAGGLGAGGMGHYHDGSISDYHLFFAFNIVNTRIMPNLVQIYFLQ